MSSSGPERGNQLEAVVGRALRGAAHHRVGAPVRRGAGARGPGPLYGWGPAPARACGPVGRSGIEGPAGKEEAMTERTTELGDADRAVLAGAPLFGALGADDRARLIAALRALHVPAGSLVMTVAQPGEVVMVVLAGTLQVQVEQADGSLVILAFLGPGDCVGEMGPLEGAERSATVAALEPCRLAWLPRDAFAAHLGAMPGLAAGLAAVLARRLRQANERIQALATLDAGARLARQLAALAADHGAPAEGGGRRILLRLSQGAIADLIGASREQVNRSLGALRRAGIVRVEADHRIVVLDAARLARRAG